MAYRRYIMAPLTKDMLEVTNSAADLNKTRNVAQPKTEKASGHLRADAVSLEVPVKVHGSRVQEVAPEGTPHTEPFEEQTSTMIVFPQGAVIRMSTAVSVGQMLVITNLKSRQDAICRVVKVRTFSNLQGYVEVEFTHKQPGYWNVYFPSEDAAANDKPSQAIAAEPTPSAPPANKKAPASARSEISWAPAPAAPSIAQEPAELGSSSPAIKLPKPPLPVAAAAKLEAPVISSGSQEKVQPAAPLIAATPVLPISQTDAVKKPVSPSASNADGATEFAPATTVQTPAAIPSVISPAQTEGSFAASEPLTESATLKSAPAAPVAIHSTFGSFSGGATLGTNRSQSAAIVEPILSSSENSSSDNKSSSGTNWVLIAACIIVLLAVVVGGAMYFRGQSSNSSFIAGNAPASTQTINPAATNANEPANSSASSTPNSNSLAKRASNVKPSIVVDGSAPVQTHDKQISTSEGGAPAKQSQARVTSDMMNATLNSHPVSSQGAASGQADAAPAVDATPAPPGSGNGSLAGMGYAAVASPPEPEIKSDGPVKVGGQVKEPRLLYSSLPVYPYIAKEANTQGDVVIQATIDKDGHVVHMEVVSGPNVLRQAAVQALGGWKYEPSKLNGQPVSVQMLVTIKFRR